MADLFFEPLSCNSRRVVHPQPPSTVGKTPARALIDAVRVGDQHTTQRILRRPDLPRITMTLAEHAAGLRSLEPCGTRSAAERHLCNGEPVDDACLRARRRFYRDRKRAQRAAQRRDAGTPTIYTDGPDIDPDIIRQWARDTGLPVGTRGRISRTIRDAYLTAHLEEATG